MSKTMKEMYEEIREEEYENQVNEMVNIIDNYFSHQIVDNVSVTTKQVGGSHYQLAIEPWDYITANNLGYLEGNVVKYVSRYKDKNGKQDLEKAIHYLEKLIEVNYGHNN